jgi:WD repeat-containing protein 23
MSIKFSGDTKEILAGTKGAEVLVYDLISNRVSTTVHSAHEDEINSVCFANRTMSNILFTGSDDSLIKVWDRRALGNNREAGIFVGHFEGITHVTSKGDGNYLASNSKD